MAGKSRRKGKVGENEVAAFLREHGVEGARRGQQFSGIAGDSDVLGLAGFHIEVKRCEALRLWPALSQARRDAKAGTTPTIWHRANGKPWVVILGAADFLALLKASGSSPSP